MEFIIIIGISSILLTVGYLAGTFAEKSHFRSLVEREAQTQHIVKTQTRAFMMPAPERGHPSMICSECVIASDYFKNFLSKFRKFFGGEMKSYNSLIERARREAILRLVEQANGFGYNAICNVRVEPVDIAGNVSKQAAATVCVVASATAYHSRIQIQGIPPAQPMPPTKTPGPAPQITTPVAPVKPPGH